MKQKDIAVVGACGLGREVAWLIERINKENQETEDTFNIIGFFDDKIEKGTKINGYPVLGKIADLIDNSAFNNINIVLAIVSPVTRYKIYNRLIKSQNLFNFPNLIDPSVIKSDFIQFGIGNIICAKSILTTNILIGNFCILNLNCTLENGDSLGDFSTICSNSNISGNVKISRFVEIGAGTQIIQGKSIGEGSIVKTGSVVVKDIPKYCTAFGNPCKPIKYNYINEKEIDNNNLINLLERTHKDSLLIFGAGGHGRVIADIASFIYKNVYFIDDDLSKPGVIGDKEFAVKNKEQFDVIIGIGNGKIRKELIDYFQNQNVDIPTLIHPNSTVALDVTLNKGTVLMAGSVINSESIIGIGCILNTSSSVDHNNKVGDYSHISVGAHSAGNVVLGSNIWLGIGTTLNNNIVVCDDVFFGSGSNVIHNTKDRGLYFGNPARLIK